MRPKVVSISRWSQLDMALPLELVGERNLATTEPRETSGSEHYEVSGGCQIQIADVARIRNTLLPGLNDAPVQMADADHIRNTF